MLRFYTAFGTQSADGARFSIAVEQQIDDQVGNSDTGTTAQEVWGEVQTSEAPIERSIDLSAYAGKNIVLALVLDPLQNVAADWAHWVMPRIIIENQSK
jgi:hypothetical protein